jgi:hypothetical protein
MQYNYAAAAVAVARSFATAILICRITDPTATQVDSLMKF